MEEFVYLNGSLLPRSLSYFIFSHIALLPRILG